MLWGYPGVIDCRRLDRHFYAGPCKSEKPSNDSHVAGDRRAPWRLCYAAIRPSRSKVQARSSALEDANALGLVQARSGSLGDAIFGPVNLEATRQAVSRSSPSNAHPATISGFREGVDAFGDARLLWEAFDRTAMNPSLTIGHSRSIPLGPRHIRGKITAPDTVD